MKKQKGLTQSRILDFIKREINSKGYPPSVREICSAVNLKSTSTVHGHLARMEKNGLIKRDTLIPRSIQIVNNKQIKNKLIPIVGRVTAGIPILAEEDIEDYISLPECMIGAGEYFILKVCGDSMIEIGINDGDNVVVRKQISAENGDIVVAMIKDEATVKRYYKEGNKIKLKPENSSMKPIICDNVQILGKVVSLYRIF